MFKILTLHLFATLLLSLANAEIRDNNLKLKGKQTNKQAV